MVNENESSVPFNRLRTVAGCALNPLSHVPMDDDILCEGPKVPTDFRSPQHKEIFDELFGAIIGEEVENTVTPTEVDVNGSDTDSNSGV